MKRMKSSVSGQSATVRADFSVHLWGFNNQSYKGGLLFA